MDIVMIGSGNVAAVLGRKLNAAGHKILQVLGRNASAASGLAYEWDTESANYMTLVNRHAQVYIIAVPDDAITPLVFNLHLPGKLVVHTAASVSKDVLGGVSEEYGVLYPLQSLRKEMGVLPDIPFYYDASTDHAKARLKELADSISFHAAVRANDDDRVKLHLAAVFANNFPNHLYALMEEYCRLEGISFDQLYPLIHETASRIEDGSPRLLQTGPAIRNDKATIEKHLALLEKYPKLKRIYTLMTESIREPVLL